LQDLSVFRACKIAGMTSRGHSKVIVDMPIERPRILSVIYVNFVSNSYSFQNITAFLSKLQLSILALNLHDHLNIIGISFHNFNRNCPSLYAVRQCKILTKSSTVYVGCNNVTDDRQTDGFAMT